MQAAVTTGKSVEEKKEDSRAENSQILGKVVPAVDVCKR